MDDDNYEMAIKEKQWDQINDHLRQMNNYLDDTHSPLSSSPNQPNQGDSLTNTYIPRPHQPHNPYYRWSEGDLQKNDIPKIINPPQSAPVLSEGYELKWVNSAPQQQPVILPNSPPGRVKNYSGSKPVWSHADHQPNAQIYVNGEPTTSNHHSSHHFIKSKSASSVFGSTTLPEKDLSVSKPDVFLENHDITSRKSYTTQICHGYNSGSNSPHILRQTSSPLLYHADSVNDKVLYGQFASNRLHNSPKSQRQAGQNYTSPSIRRKSAPVSDHLGYNVGNQSRRAMSQAGVATTSLSGYGTQDIFKPIVIPESKTLGNVDSITSLLPTINVDDDNDSNTEDEYTAALLQHQTDRRYRLHDEYLKKQAQLVTLVNQVQILETRVMKRNQASKNYIPVSSLQLDVRKLRDINRRLEIDCNCMYKEVDLFSRDGDSTRENFYSRYDRKPVKSKKASARSFPPGPLPSPPIPPPQEKDDEPKWRCSHCTFDNHAALNKCEICEFPREVASSRARNS